MADDFLLHRAGAGPIDYSFDWSSGWEYSGETISSSSWTIGPVGPTLSGQTYNSTTTAVSVTATSAHAGKTYQLTNTITSSFGFSDVRSITIRVAYP